MTESVTADSLPIAKEAAAVSASALAPHVDCTRTYIGKLEAERMIQRQGDGFRVRCLPPLLAARAAAVAAQ
ncbi:hypothetical protein ACH79_06505 [Bradyrhizobium sp. CCBAU 051011]|uniref:hypothetical protein n=1 Tax=Bradyrhizobium sp. CCBAU 051011 TaxID=858422 RepID=UPI001373B7DB|nr:hypothetical protein [Bradyrhizobium sp. CCBAU 051011]QHO72330.1 hypothetical protein ACH79_06505 [Bradyrhizobium sp. CCBAU 051011]